MKIIFILLTLASLYTAGCAKDSGVVLAKDVNSFFDSAVVYHGEVKILAEDATGSEQYRVFHQGATGFVPLSMVREEVEEQAKDFCEKTGKTIKILQEIKSVPPHILGNWPRAELLFVCITKPSVPSFEVFFYIKLTNLKKLLDDGTITKEEFEQQKAKILNQKLNP